jgi:hypothetical protein
MDRLFGEDARLARRARAEMIVDETAAGVGQLTVHEWRDEWVDGFTARH